MVLHKVRVQRAHVMPFGAEVREDGTIRFALWAPSARRVELELQNLSGLLAMEKCGDGWYERIVEAQAGTCYRFAIDGALRVPDPAARFQPDDVHGFSEAIDPRAFTWEDAEHRVRSWEELAIYELHVGSFTPEGTYAGVVERLDALAELGITAIELMPLSATPGARNWGYDGVLPFAPEARYGRPEELKRLIVEAHRRGLAVILDVVYNHFGPEGNYLHAYAKPFFTERCHTPWGMAIDYERRREVREFVLHNAAYWLEEYGFDGLRLDAVQQIYDRSNPHIIEELVERANAAHPHARPFIILETDERRFERLATQRGERGRADAQWYDNIHHGLHVLLTGECDGYYDGFADKPAEHLARSLAAWLPSAFVSCLQNHDQIGNRALGERITMLAPIERVRAAAAVLLLAPSIPLLFMGEEWAASTPFPYFCDFEPNLAEAVRNGRRSEFAHFKAFAEDRARERIPDPGALSTFSSAVLRWEEREEEPHRGMLAWYRSLLHLRAKEIVPRLPGMRPGCGEVLATQGRALCVRWRMGDGSALSVAANLGEEPVALEQLEGRVIFATDASITIRGASLAPWSVIWRIAEE